MYNGQKLSLRRGDNVRSYQDRNDGFERSACSSSKRKASYKRSRKRIKPPWK